MENSTGNNTTLCRDSNNNYTRSLKDIFENELRDIYIVHNKSKITPTDSANDELKSKIYEKVLKAEQLFCLLGVSQPTNILNYKNLRVRIEEELHKIQGELNEIHQKITLRAEKENLHKDEDTEYEPLKYIA